MSLWDLLFGGGSDTWGPPTGGIPGMADAMGQDLEDLLRNSPQIMNSLASMTPDQSVVQPTIDAWSDPNQYAREDPFWMTADVTGLAGGAKGIAGAARGAADNPATTLGRLINDERGGNQFWTGNPKDRPPGYQQLGGDEPPKPPSSGGPDAGNLFDEALRRYRNERQPGMTGEISERTPDSLSNEGRGIHEMLKHSSIGEPPPTPAPGMLEVEARIQRAMQEQGGLRRLMEETDNTGHTTPMKAQGGGTEMVHRPGMVKGEGFEDPYRALSERRSNSRVTQQNPIDQALDTRPGQHTGVFSYEGAGGMRDLLDNPKVRRSGGDIEDVRGIDKHKTTLAKLNKDLNKQGTPEGEGRFVPKYRPKPDPRRVARPQPPKTGVDRGPTPFERGQRS